jgi:hypothetical protein
MVHFLHISTHPVQWYNNNLRYHYSVIYLVHLAWWYHFRFVYYIVMFNVSSSMDSLLFWWMIELWKTPAPAKSTIMSKAASHSCHSNSTKVQSPHLTTQYILPINWQASKCALPCNQSAITAPPAEPGVVHPILHQAQSNQSKQATLSQFVATLQHVHQSVWVNKYCFLWLHLFQKALLRP